MTYKHQFIKFMVENGVLKFGEFTLKSGYARRTRLQGHTACGYNGCFAL